MQANYKHALAFELGRIVEIDSVYLLACKFVDPVQIWLSWFDKKSTRQCNFIESLKTRLLFPNFDNPMIVSPLQFRHRTIQFDVWPKIEMLTIALKVFVEFSSWREIRHRVWDREVRNRCSILAAIEDCALCRG